MALWSYARLLRLLSCNEPEYAVVSSLRPSMEHGTPTALETRPPEPKLPETHVVRTRPPEPPRRSWIGWVVVLALAGVGYWQWPRLKALMPSGETTSQGTAK